MRRGLWALGFVVLGSIILFAVTGLSYVSSLLPQGQAERVTGPHGIVGLDTGGSFAWVVPVRDGVVLVDAGIDRDAAALRKEVGGRPVLGILLTHGHADHTAGVAAFPDAPVWLAEADHPLLSGAVEERSPLAIAYRRVAGTPANHGELSTVADAAEVTLGGEVFHATAAPGVTAGSVTWLWRDVLFTGDAVWGGAALQLPPDALCEDAAGVKDAARRQLPLDFDTVADGQIGVSSTARAALHALLGAELSPPTVSVREGAAGEQRTGWFVRAPAPDARGDRPEWLVVPGSPPVALAAGPERDAWVGRWVTVDGVPRGGGLEVRGITAATTPEPAVPAPTTPEALERWVDRYPTVSGTVRSFAPLAAGSAWGEGILALPGEGSVALHAPVSAGLAGPVTLTAKVVKGADGRLALVAVAAPNP